MSLSKSFGGPLASLPAESRAIPYENQKCQGVELKIAPRARVNLEVQGPEDVVRSQHFSPINDDAAPV